MEVKLSDSALEDIQTIKMWYQDIPDVYPRIEKRLEFIFEKLSQFPYLYPQKRKRAYRVAYLGSFPYQVIHQISTTQVEIIAIVHTAQHPNRYLNCLP